MSHFFKCDFKYIWLINFHTVKLLNISELKFVLSHSLPLQQQVVLQCKILKWRKCNSGRRRFPLQKRLRLYLTRGCVWTLLTSGLSQFTREKLLRHTSLPSIFNSLKSLFLGAKHSCGAPVVQVLKKHPAKPGHSCAVISEVCPEHNGTLGRHWTLPVYEVSYRRRQTFSLKPMEQKLLLLS